MMFLSSGVILSGEMWFLLLIPYLFGFQCHCASALFYRGSVHHRVPQASFLVADIGATVVQMNS